MMHKLGTLAALGLLAMACNQEAGDAKGSASATTAPAAASAPVAAASAAAEAPAAEVPTTDLTPKTVKENAAKLMGKSLSGSGVMYFFETTKLNGQTHHWAYVADDEAKTNSFKCVLEGDPKIEKNSKVKFEGEWRGGWLDKCKLTKE